MKKDVSGLIYGLIKKVNLLEKRLTELETKLNGKDTTVESILL